MTAQEKENIKAILSMQKTMVDNIYDACKENSDNFEVDYTPIIYLNFMCDTALDSITIGLNAGSNNPDLSKQEKKSIEMVRKMNASMLGTIKNACKKNADMYHVDYVPVKFLKTICDDAYSKLETGLKKGFGN